MHCLKKNLNASRPSEHPPVRGGGDVETFRWDHKLQRQSPFMAFNRVPPIVVTEGQQYSVGEKPIIEEYFSSVWAKQ